MSPQLTPEYMTEAFDRHSDAEMSCQLDATMDTVAPEPVYELWPRGLRIAGRDAVADFYRRQMDAFIPRIVGGERHSAAFGERVVVFEDSVEISREDGPPLKLRITSVVEYDEASGLLQGERLYLDDAFAAIFDDVLGPDFLDVPGVTRVGAE